MDRYKGTEQQTVNPISGINAGVLFTLSTPPIS
jgi:hypothetical protein